MTNAEQRFSQRQSLYDACLVTDRPGIPWCLIRANPNKLPVEMNAFLLSSAEKTEIWKNFIMAIIPVLRGFLGEKVCRPDE